MKSLALRIALLLSTILLLLIFGEVASRVLAWSRAVADAKAASGDTGPVPELTDVFELAKPNVRGMYRGVPYRTNSFGLRGPDYSAYPPRGGFRILVAGDSVTMGWAVPEELAYPAQLERLLEQAKPPLRGEGPGPDRPRYEVINLGLAGVNAGFSSRRLQRFLDLYHPDLDVYGFTLNDIEGPHYRKLDKESRKALNQAVWRRALRFEDSPFYLLRELWPRVISVLEWDAFHPSEAERIGPQAREWYENYFENPEAWAEFEAALDMQAEAAAAHGICSVVFLHTHLTELTPEHRHEVIYERVADAARARGLYVIESLPLFLGRDPEALHVNAFDIHPNADGHALLAQALLAGLRTLPPACLRDAEQRGGYGAGEAPAGAPSGGADDPGTVDPGPVDPGTVDSGTADSGAGAAGSSR